MFHPNAFLKKLQEWGQRQISCCRLFVKGLGKNGRIIMALYKSMVVWLEHCTVLVTPSEKNVIELEKVQKRTTKLIKRLVNLIRKYYSLGIL